MGVKAAEAELLLRQQGLTQEQARNLLKTEDGTLWQRRLVSPPGRGIGVFALPHVEIQKTATATSNTADPQESLSIDMSQLVVRMASDHELTPSGK
jgi:hypothetical protein